MCVILVRMTRGEDKLNVEGGLRTRTLGGEFEENRHASSVIKHRDGEVKWVTEFENRPQILTKNCEGHGGALHEGVDVELTRVEGDFGAEHEVGRVGDVVDKTGDTHGRLRGGQSDLVETNMKVSQDIKEESGTGPERTGGRALVEGGEADAAGDYRDAEALDDVGARLQLEENVNGVCGGGDAQSDNGLGRAEDGVERARVQLGRGRGAAQSRLCEEGAVTTEVGEGRLRGVDHTQRQRGWRLW